MWSGVDIVEKKNPKITPTNSGEVVFLEVEYLVQSREHKDRA